VLTLVSATADDSGIDTHWSSAVTPGTAAGVRVYREDGRPIAGSYTVSATTDATVLRVGLPATGTAEPASEVLIGVDPGVAMAVGPTGPTGPNGYGAAPLRTGAQAPGYTDAPDLLSLQYATDRVTLGFDEAVALPIDAAGIRLLLADGSSQPATAVSADGKAVAVQFSGPVASGVGVAVDPGAVVDATGENAGPRGAAGGAPPPAPSATTTPAPSVTATVTAVATVAPAATATPTVVSVASRQRRVVPALLSSLVRHNRQVSGLLQAAAPCQKGRRIAVSSRGAQLGATRTKRHGGFEVKARKLVATRITVTVKKRVIKRSRVTIVCRRVSGKV
jgi:hypothetical protein